MCLTGILHKRWKVQALLMTYNLLNSIGPVWTFYTFHLVTLAKIISSLPNIFPLENRWYATNNVLHIKTENQILWWCSATNAYTQVCGWNGSPAMLATKRSAGVTQNLRNPLHAGDKARKGEGRFSLALKPRADITRSSKQKYQWPH